MLTANRYHDISCGHRVVGHEGKCRFMHGHNYRIHFYCKANELDSIGRVIDFSVIKDKLCLWLENNWDHQFLYWLGDSVITEIADKPGIFAISFVPVEFNPTAENMAKYLVEEVGPRQLLGTGVTLVKVVIEETQKCSVTYELEIRK